MTLTEWIVLYFGGLFLGVVFSAFRIGDRVEVADRPWVGWLVTTVGWPLLLPFSFYALAGNVLWLFGVRLPGMKFGR